MPAPMPMYYPVPMPMPMAAPAPAAPAQPTQNPPAVQPLVIVPYVSQMQPLYQYSPQAMREMYAKGEGPFSPDFSDPYAGNEAYAVPYPTASESQTYASNAYDNANVVNSYNASPAYSPEPAYQADPYAQQYAQPYGQPYPPFDSYQPDPYQAPYQESYYDPYTASYDEAPAEQKKGRRANAAAIFGFIFGLIAVAFMVIGYFNFLPETIAPYLCVVKDATVMNILLTDLIEAIQNIPPFDVMAMILPAAIALSALFTILTLLTNLFSVAARRYPIAGKVFAWLAFIFAGAAVGYLLATAMSDVKIGAYILAGITLLIAIICTTGRRK